jgi:hypothetical protein
MQIYTQSDGVDAARPLGEALVAAMGRQDPAARRVTEKSWIEISLRIARRSCVFGGVP